MKLFVEDRFSRKRPNWKMVKDEDLKVEIKSKLPSSLKLSLGGINSIKSPESAEINSNNIMLLGDKKTLVIKKFNIKKTKELSNQIYIYREIDKKKLPFPKIIKTNKGYIFQLGKNSYGIALEFIHGNYFNGSIKDLKKTAETIAFCMSQLKSTNYTGFKTEKIFPSDSHDIIKKFMTSLSEKNHFNEYEKKLLNENYKKILSVEDEILGKLGKFKKIKFELLHRDLHPHNIILNKSNVYLLDVDSIMLTKWPIAVGFAVFKLLRQFCVRNIVDNHNIDHMHNFIHSINKFGNTKDVYYKDLFLGAKIEILRRILVIMRGNLGENVSPWNPVLEIQIRSLSELEYLEKKLT